jgi:hypothetical protein
MGKVKQKDSIPTAAMMRQLCEWLGLPARCKELKLEFKHNEFPVASGVFEEVIITDDGFSVKQSFTEFTKKYKVKLEEFKGKSK